MPFNPGCVAVVAAVAVILVLAGLVKMAGEGQSSGYRPSSTPWAGWAVLGWLFVAVAAALLLATAVFLFVKLWHAYLKSAAHVKAVQFEARTVRAQESGLLPNLLTRDGDAMVDPNAAPVVRGLNGNPDVGDEAAATERAAVLRGMAVSGGVPFRQEEPEGHVMPEVRVIGDGLDY